MYQLGKKFQALLLKPGLILLSVAGFFAVGFGPTFFLGTPQLGFMLAVGAIIPFGSTALNLPRALGRAIALGLVAGVGLTWALGIARHGEVPRAYAAIYIGSMIIACTGTAGLFFRLAQRRKKLADDQWK